jgi:FtsP/CotA-like multicopper oxidase with cupredoxin domain
MHTIPDTSLNASGGLSSINRRQFLIGAGTGAGAGTAIGTTYAQIAGAPDYSLRIAPLRLELAPGKVIDTFSYDGSVPGPVLRLREGRQIAIDIRNDTDVDDIIHWHGLYVPSVADGAMAKPTGTRWYHSHDAANTDLRRSLYAGLYGFMIIEPAGDAGHYDREVLLAAHHWEGSWVSMQDIRQGPPPDNGLEVLYKSASFNDRMLGHSEPLRVREGDRVLFRLLNASATQNVTLALPGHHFTVVTLDGNPVPVQRTTNTLFLAPSERADAIVEMNRPGVWILGGIRDEELLFEKVPGGRGGYNRWTINGRSWPATNPLFTTDQGKRYRLIMTNKSGDNHPVHLHRHTFEVTKVGDKQTAGLMKDTINMTRFSTVEIDFVANDPGPTLLHCHHQDHQDEGFMGLMTYI